MNSNNSVDEKEVAHGLVNEEFINQVVDICCTYLVIYIIYPCKYNI